MKEDVSTEMDYEFRISTSNLSERVGKTYFTTEMTIMKCISGSAVISINSRKHILNTGHNFLLSDSVIFQVLETTEDFSVVTCFVSLPFYFELATGINSNVFDILPYSAPDLYKIEYLLTADLLFESLCLLYNNCKHGNRRTMVMNIIECYIYEIYELTLTLVERQIEEDKNNHHRHTINAFYKLVAIHGQEHRNIEFYAGQLNMSSRYLYKIVQSGIHITPKQLIDDMVVSSIKQLLLTTKLNNQEIADRFNFPDQSSFGQYFKRCSGMSPLEFRNKHR